MTISPRSVPLDYAIAPILEAALHAPSSHNTQPWRFRVAGRAIRLYADRSRSLPINDPEDRELAISCGCALFHIRVAAAAEGLAATAAILPDPDSTDLLATVTLQPAERRSLPDAALAEYIERRHSYRNEFEPAMISDYVLDRLAAAAEQEGAWLQFVSSVDHRQQLATLIAEGDAAHWANPGWRRELARWVHPRDAGDGLPVNWMVAPLAQAAIRTLDLGGRIGARDRHIADDSPVLAIIGAAGDSPADWIAAGQALGRVLLEACSHDVQASFLNQPVQIPTLRPRLQSLLGHAGQPQIVLRFGHPAGDPPRTPRRQLQEVLDSQG